MSAVAVSYTVDGAAGAPVVVLSNSLGATRGMWDPQVPALAERYRVVSYDARGHGESPAPAGPYTLDDLVDDLVALLDEVGAERAHVAGLSLGGMTALRLAVREPQRLDRLAVLCTSAKPDPQPFLDRAAAVRSGGTAPLAPAIAARWLTPALRRRAPGAGRQARGDDRRGGRRGLCRLRRGGRRAWISGRTSPASPRPPSSSAGEEDLALPPAHQQLIADGIPGAGCSP